MSTDVLGSKTDQQLIDSLLAEVAKSSNEVKCSKADIAKIESRLSFAIVILNELKHRNKIQTNQD